MIRSETGIKRTKQETIIKKFLEKGILSNVEVKGNPPIKYIRLNFRWIYENLGKFCIMSEKQDFNNMRVDYFKALVEINKIFVDTNEQENNIENNKEIIEDALHAKNNEDMHFGLPFKSALFINKWQEWLNHNKEAKRTLTSYTINAQLNMLSKYSEAIAIQIIDQSIISGYAGLFELNNKRKSQQPATFVKPDWIKELDGQTY